MTTTIERQIIIGAIRLLDSPDKWCKSRLTDIGPGGIPQYCIRGAINEAGRALGLKSTWTTGPGKKADVLIGKAYNGREAGSRHIHFQNRSSTTFAQMRSLLQKALTL